MMIKGFSLAMDEPVVTRRYEPAPRATVERGVLEAVEDADLVRVAEIAARIDCTVTNVCAAARRLESRGRVRLVRVDNPRAGRGVRRQKTVWAVRARG